MTPKAEALRILHESIPEPLPAEEVELLEALGRVLAADVTSDVDMPPFDRSAMDGYAVRAADVTAPGVELRVVDVVKAGEVSAETIGPGTCAKIMTGAPVPAGADAVIMVEQTRATSGGAVMEARAESGQNIAPRGQDMRAGEVVLRAGTPVRAIEIGVLATVGQARVRVHRRPSVGVVATGDELVDPAAAPPGPGQIRETNARMLTAQVRSLGLGIGATHLGIARDDPAAVRAALERGLAHDVLILSGGVSMGDFDFVHTELEARGLDVLIEKVAIKPGKPLLFGRLAGPDGRPRHVFGLPGNPVSSYVTFELFVRPFLRGLMGRPGPHAIELAARLEGAASVKPIPRAQHLPACVTLGLDGRVSARPVSWHGSGDLRGLADCNGFILVEAGAGLPAAGATVRVLLSEPDVLRIPPHVSRG